MNVETLEVSRDAVRALAIAFLAGLLLGMFFVRGVNIRLMMFNVLVGSNHNRINP